MECERFVELPEHLRRILTHGTPEEKTALISMIQAGYVTAHGKFKTRHAAVLSKLQKMGVLTEEEVVRYGDADAYAEFMAAVLGVERGEISRPATMATANETLLRERDELEGRFGIEIATPDDINR